MRLVVARVSTPHRACGSAARNVSTIASEMRSQTLSGWPSDTDSLVKTKSCFAKDHLPLNRLHQSPGLPLAAPFRSGRVGPQSRCRVVECRAASVKPDLPGDDAPIGRAAGYFGSPPAAKLFARPSIWRRSVGFLIR